ncbi:hypothetical protein PC129_g3103 [Phytophthora cactorum]|uniref:Uncharacterized protein n=2 Tax=Phytophthora cactorum TaxID=29920 RepID=A0A8T1E9T9_9STRA|nr:hypothetical protein PC114_g4054 [Phytophthora cactorum]KAG2938950.1 hypothetical protein PC115_g3419 [Phytophthora cactorum]KAG2949941.1 hypothetical protein PC117_g4815 [Phytophthora cactorum]KAG2992857.1 hypothetical protein PC118_g4308 [Phytophthora cactorum]KAG3035384.1 hypothetical protein PC119_g4615 [Phytophthora cactorum]
MGEDLNDCAENGSVHAEQAAPQPIPGSKKNKVDKRFKGSNEMVAELLRLRFADNDAKRRLEADQTKTQAALAWQYFASVLPESLGVVINHEQVSQKYRKLKCIYRKEKREEGKTGNCARALREIDDQLWGILHDAFSDKVGISGEILLGSHLDGGESDNSGEEPGSGCAVISRADESAPTSGKSKLSPIESLASSMQTGMEAIAASMSMRNSPHDSLKSLIVTLQQQHEEIRRLQALQLQLLQQLVARESA